MLVLRGANILIVIGVITFELNQHIDDHGISVPQTDRQTDRQTDGRLTVAIPCNAHSASCGKNAI